MEGENHDEMVTMTKPAWLQGLMAETFFITCGVHENRRKNEKNIFCLDCCQSFCPHCLPYHRSHPLLQVRRYLYQDVIRLDEFEKLMDCSHIQSYTINGAKVIFLSQRAQTRPCKTVNACFTCDRILQDPFHFCSISCKVDYQLVYEGQDLSSILYTFDKSDFALSQFEGLQMDGGSSCSNNSMVDSGFQEELEMVKNKKKGGGFVNGIMFTLSSRRKGAPHRSPLS